ncbi:hypothetical protein [Leyella stercorea]|uniref:hypothetical protein n=1 Tax=Leyella stercorea TaxID=363265 RepID=UPI00242EBC06|nr:hypothetical protein [Leyella stercorea]
MKKYLFILLVCFAAISCNSYDDEIGYVVTTEGTCLQDVISANHTSCKIKYGQTIKDVAGTPKLSKVIFKLSGDGEEVIVDAQKGDDDLYYAEIEIPYDRNVTISTIATINGEDESISVRTLYYNKSHFCPEIADSICTNPQNYDVIRYIVECKNSMFESKISEATVTIGKKTYPLTITDDNKIYCDIDLYDIADCSCYPVLTIKNEVDEYKINGGAHIKVKKNAITGYDTSEDGKEIDGCIYLAGTKWAKGVIVQGTGGKNYLDINEEDGIKTYANIWNAYLDNNNLDGYKIPSLEQAENIIHYCSIQQVKAENAVNRQYVVYPAKKNERIKSFFYNIKSIPIADIRKNGVYIKDYESYTSIRYKNAYGGYDPSVYYYYPEYENMFKKYSLSSYWCLLLPIKD